MTANPLARPTWTSCPFDVPEGFTRPWFRFRECGGAYGPSTEIESWVRQSCRTFPGSWNDAFASLVALVDSGALDPQILRDLSAVAGQEAVMLTVSEVAGLGDDE